MLPSYTRVALRPTKFFSADAANVPLISPTAPAQEGYGCQCTAASGDCPVGTRSPTDGVWPAFLSFPGRLPGLSIEASPGAKDRDDA
jgi:hypothetical protein